MSGWKNAHLREDRGRVSPLPARLHARVRKDRASANLCSCRSPHSCRPPQSAVTAQHFDLIKRQVPIGTAELADDIHKLNVLKLARQILPGSSQCIGPFCLRSNTTLRSFLQRCGAVAPARNAQRLRIGMRFCDGLTIRMVSIRSSIRLRLG